MERDALDFETIYDIYEGYEYKNYDFYIGEPYQTNYQEVFDQEISSEQFERLESKLIMAIKKMCKFSNVQGMVNIYGEKIRKNPYARKSEKYYKDLKHFEKEVGNCNMVMFDENSIDMPLIVATRGIGETILVFKEIGVILRITDLHGFMIFKCEEHIKTVLNSFNENGVVCEGDKCLGIGGRIELSDPRNTVEMAYVIEQVAIDNKVGCVLGENVNEKLVGPNKEYINNEIYFEITDNPFVKFAENLLFMKYAYEENREELFKTKIMKISNVLKEICDKILVSKDVEEIAIYINYVYFNEWEDYEIYEEKDTTKIYEILHDSYLKKNYCVPTLCLKISK